MKDREVSAKKKENDAWGKGRAQEKKAQKGYLGAKKKVLKGQQEAMGKTNNNLT